jgi:molecular chaperone DnaK (HSP70)
MATQPLLSIDFGTRYSRMARFNHSEGKPKILHNAEGQEKTPSIVYYGDGINNPLIGTPAEQILEDDGDETEWQHVIASVKRELVNAPTIALPTGRVEAVKVVADIMDKLKRDAEALHFNQKPVKRVVLTYPAAFTSLECEKLKEAAELAGFTDIKLIDEPTAAAMAYHQAGKAIGSNVLVYDLGAGTFNLTLLTRNKQNAFAPAMKPDGLARCGGDDFDRALYDYCEQIARNMYNKGVSRDDNLNLNFLSQCRKRKENLSNSERVVFSSYLPDEAGGSWRFEHEVTRATFEDLIRPKVEETIQLTASMLKEADLKGHQVDTVILVGGSSQIPLVQQRLQEALQLEVREFKRDTAVVRGAVCYGSGQIEPHKPSTKPGSRPNLPPRQTSITSSPSVEDVWDMLSSIFFGSIWGYLSFIVMVVGIAALLFSCSSSSPSSSPPPTLPFLEEYNEQGPLRPLPSYQEYREQYRENQ